MSLELFPVGIPSTASVTHGPQSPIARPNGIPSTAEAFPQRFSKTVTAGSISSTLTMGVPPRFLTALYVEGFDNSAEPVD